MGKRGIQPKHILTAVDPVSRRADCSMCGGRVSIFPGRTGTTFNCQGLVKGRAGGFAHEAPALPAIPETEVAYLSGVFDGEGCVFVQTNLRLSITNTSLALLERWQSGFGGTIYDGRDAPPHKRQWQLAVTSAPHVLAVLQRMYPYLTVKRAEAALALTWPLQVSNVERLTDADRDSRVAIASRLRMLKRA